MNSSTFIRSIVLTFSCLAFGSAFGGGEFSKDNKVGIMDTGTSEDHELAADFEKFATGWFQIYTMHKTSKERFIGVGFSHTLGQWSGGRPWTRVEEPDERIFLPTGYYLSTQAGVMVTQGTELTEKVQYRIDKAGENQIAVPWFYKVGSKED